MHPLEALKENPFVLAPMAGITDHAFRSFMKSMGAGIVVTELVSATGMKYGSERTFDLMSFDETQRPIGIQLFGEDPETLAEAAKMVQDKGADFVDLNFGCPVPKVTKKGAGSAMLKDLENMQKVLSATVKAVKIPVSIKIRIGWDENSKNALDVCNLAYNEGIMWVAIHGRTRAQGYSGSADWNLIKHVKAETKIPVIGNGDILSATSALRRLNESGCDGVMIGRGALKNPFIFLEALSLYKEKQYEIHIEKNFKGVFDSLRNYVVAHCDEHIVNIQLKKFAAWFSTGYPGASQFRKNIFQTKSNVEVIQIASDYFSSIGDLKQEDTSHEPFLMGGHG